jgi:hypothetical protein
MSFPGKMDESNSVLTNSKRFGRGNVKYCESDMGYSRVAE